MLGLSGYFFSMIWFETDTMVKSDKSYRQNIKKILSGENDRLDQSSQMTLNGMNELISYFPGSPDFFGKKLKYPKKNEGGFFSKRKEIPDLGTIRLDINNFANKETVASSRIKLQKLLKKHPENADLHALNAVRVFNDAMQSGLDQRKFDVIRGALQEIGTALYNGGLTIFNVNWFVKIYLNYLEVLSMKVRKEIRQSSQNISPRVQKSVEILRHQHLELMIMGKVKSSLTNLTNLTTRLKGTEYITEQITDKEILQASRAYQTGDENKKVGKKTANHIVYVLMTVNLLFTKIPIMNGVISETLRKIPDIARDLILQKHTIITAQRVNDYQLAMAKGEKEVAQKIANHISVECRRVIKKHLEYAILTKYYEIDPFIKAAWIALESKDFYSTGAYQENLRAANDLLKTVMGERSQYKGSYESIKQLQSDILFKMTSSDGNAVDHF